MIGQIIKVLKFLQYNIMNEERKYIKLLENLTGKKVILEFVDDRADNLYTKAANKVSGTLDILLGDLQELFSLSDEQSGDDDFIIELNVYKDQTEEIRDRIASMINIANEDVGEPIEEASIGINSQPKGAVRVTTDQFTRNVNGKLKPILDKDIDVELTDLS